MGAMSYRGPAFGYGLRRSFARKAHSGAFRLLCKSLLTPPQGGEKEQRILRVSIYRPSFRSTSRSSKERNFQTFFKGFLSPFVEMKMIQEPLDTIYQYWVCRLRRLFQAVVHQVGLRV